MKKKRNVWSRCFWLDHKYDKYSIYMTCTRCNEAYSYGEECSQTLWDYWFWIKVWSRKKWGKFSQRWQKYDNDDNVPF